MQVIWHLEEVQAGYMSANKQREKEEKKHLNKHYKTIQTNMPFVWVPLSNALPSDAQKRKWRKLQPQ